MGNSTTIKLGAVYVIIIKPSENVGPKLGMCAHRKASMTNREVTKDVQRLSSKCSGGIGGQMRVAGWWGIINGKGPKSLQRDVP